MKNFTFLFLVLFTSVSFGQKKYPQKDFRSPLDIPIVLAGTFGELRNNHFHSGIDIKTQQREGLNIYAVADGYVSRIRVSLWGYGKVIYITHPNGYTTVYAHLSKFGKGIEEYVKKIQYQKERYETGNIYLKPGKILVKKGQVIAFSGSTGGVVSAHLHYEIRNTKSEKIINPMLFGISVKDTITPVFKGLFVYPIGDSSSVNNAVKKSLLSFKPKGNNSHTTNRVSANGAIGFAVHVYDKLNNTYNRNGIYSLEMFVNGLKVYHHNLESFSFAESKYINLLIDYKQLAQYKRRFQRTHKVDGNQLSIYKKLTNNGILQIKKGFNYNVEIVATDFKGNKSTLKIPIRGVESNRLFSKQKDTTAFKINATQFHKFQQKNVTVAFPKNTFYNDFYLDFTIENGIARIHKPTIPLDKKYTLTFDVSTYTEEEKNQLYIANLNNKKYPSYQATVKKKTTFYTTTKTLGKYTLLSDNQIPIIKLKNFKDKQWLSKSTRLIVKISDKDSGIKSYRATIDDQWILMEYDLKKKQLVYQFKDKELVGSKHEFNIVVSDNVGNTNMLNATFYKKQ